MKQTTQNIYNVLKQQSNIDGFNQLKSNNPTYIFQETSITESYDSFVRIADLIIKTADNNLFDNIPFSKRNQIWSAVSTINQHVNQCRQFSFNFSNGNVVNLANSIIQQTNNLIDFVETANLFAKSIGLEDYKEEIKNLSGVRKKYLDLLKQLNELDKLQTQTDEVFKVANQTNDDINKILTEIKEKLKNITQLEIDVAGNAKKTNEVSILIKESEKEIEGKKLQVNTFAGNIEEYKAAIKILQEEAEKIISKEKVIDDLILQAEKALNLKSAQGISAAFSTQYHTANETGILKIQGKKINLWLIGASVFILSALGITIWIATGHLGSNGIGISLIVARIVAVAISITGATFCAKQFIKQRNIAEDYAYKAVLSKSIIAFADEIRKKDPQKVAEYLTKVLDEIHKDPLRPRDDKDEKDFNFLPTSLMEKIVEKIGNK